MIEFNEDIFTFKPDILESEIDAQSNSPDPTPEPATPSPAIGIPNIAEHRRWIWNQIGNVCNEQNLDTFRKRFETDIIRYPDFRKIAAEARELIEARRGLAETWPFGAKQVHRIESSARSPVDAAADTRQKPDSNVASVQAGDISRSGCRMRQHPTACPPN